MDQKFHPPTVTAGSDPRARAASWGPQVIVTAIVFLMVVKPLG